MMPRKAAPSRKSKVELTTSHSRRQSPCTPMNRFWQIVALLMLALVVPASTCCQWANGCESQEQCHCCTDEGHEAPASPEVCPSHTLAHSQVPAQAVLPAMQMIELAQIIQEMTRLNELLAAKEPPVPLMTTAPPELWTTWVFESRAALPARAPAELV